MRSTICVCTAASASAGVVGVIIPPNPPSVLDGTNDRIPMILSSPGPRRERMALRGGGEARPNPRQHPLQLRRQRRPEGKAEVLAGELEAEVPGVEEGAIQAEGR